MCCGLVNGKPVRTACFNIRHAVAVGILEIPDVRRISHQDALLPAHHAGRQRQMIGEDRDLVGNPVAVGVPQQLDAPELAIDVERIAAVLDHVKIAVLVELHCDGRTISGSAANGSMRYPAWI